MCLTDDFAAHGRPAQEVAIVKIGPPPLPPYNGYGSYEDSAANCRNVIPIPPQRDFVKFLSKDRYVHTQRYPTSLQWIWII